MSRTSLSEASPSRVLSAAYLERHSSKNDLVRRLRTINEALSDDDVEPDSPDYPGLAGLAAVLVEDKYLNHRDKEVRLHTVLACMELFYLYAPEPPWDETEIIKVFSQMIRQLANLAHCTSPSQPNFQHYFHILDQLATVKIGVVLVELTKTLESDQSPLGVSSTFDAHGTSREEALETLADLIKTILTSVHIDHPAQVHSNAITAVSACIDEFDSTLPIPILDEILTCVSGSPTVYVTNPEAVVAAARMAKSKEKLEKMPPMQIQQTNPSYMVAAAIIRRTLDKISTPIAALLNGLMNGDTNITAQTNITSSENNNPSEKTAFAAAPKEEKQSTADVWTIVYELHRISPQILTTVIGTVTSSLQEPELGKRLKVTKLLGHLFYAPVSKIGVQFGPCYREWIRRSQDIEPKVRQAMVKYLITILSNKGQETMLAKDASAALVKMIESDPVLDIRLQAIHQVCDLAYKAKDHKRVPPASGASSAVDSTAYVPPRLLQAVGNRVSSKNKTERRDALTGLAQIYFRHYAVEKLRQVQSGGDDCDIRVILDALHDTSGEYVESHAPKGGRNKKRKSFCDLDDEDHSSDDMDEKYRWIPRKIFESACFTDATDPEMRNRVVQIIDDVLLGSGNASDGKSKKDTLTPTSRALGLAFIMDSLRNEEDEPRGPIKSNAFKWMCSLFTQRASLQRAVRSYIDARTKQKLCTAGTEEALKAEVETMHQLETVASLTAPVLSSGSSSNSPSNVKAVLEKLNGAKDKHIFRILATIASSTHSASARARAFDELPKRTKSLGDTTAAWVKTLARRCAMGHFMNIETINHCILLAQECFHEDDLAGCMAFLSCVQMSVAIYPTVCGTKDGFGTLVELFGECRAVNTGKRKIELEESGIVTVLSSVLAAAAPARAAYFLDQKSKGKSKQVIDPDLQAQLMNLCTRDGTPQQAKFAVYTMAALLKPTNDAKGKEHDTFGPLLKALTSPSRMTLSSSNNEKTKVVSVLAALASLADCAPSAFSTDSSRGVKAIRFALETVLLGRNCSENGDIASDEEESSDEEFEEQDTPSSIKSRRKSKVRRSEVSKESRSSEGNTGILEDSALSLASRRACAAIEFLVSHIRSSVIRVNTQPLKERSAEDDKENQRLAENRNINHGDTTRKDVLKDEQDHLNGPSIRHIQQVFGILTQILQDNGLPPSSRDRRECRSSADRAALRQCASVSLLRLCDARLKLEKTHLTPGRWKVLSGSMLDEETTVRASVMDELRQMLTGQGNSRKDAPSLRLVSLVALCTDGEHGSGQSAANGNAAYMGKRSLGMKNAALQCITSLRKTSDLMLAQCRARGHEGMFESRYKMMLMPEFAVPYALHLLSFRRETPSVGGTSIAGIFTQPISSKNKTEKEDALGHDEEGRHKVLKKRLKWIFEPLVQSLGEGADNISFLMRMTEMVGNHYQPIDVSRDLDSLSIRVSPKQSLSPGVDDSGSEAITPDHILPTDEALILSAVKLKIVCVAAREVLLSFVKKDVNLSPYPGAVQIPGNLFKRIPSSNIPLPRSSQSRQSFQRQDSLDSAASKSRDASRPPRLSVDSANRNSIGRARKSHVHFSPEVDHGGNIFTSDPVDNNDESAVVLSNELDHNGNYGGFGGLSPIHSSDSPSQAQLAKSRKITSTASSEELTMKTLCKTSPSILRSDESKSRLSDSSRSSDNTSLRETRRSSRWQQTASPKDESFLSTATTPSVSQSSFDASTPRNAKDEESPKSSREKRKSSNGTNVKKRRKKASPVPIRIGPVLQSMKKPASQNRRSKATRKEPMILDEFDFPDDEETQEEASDLKSGSLRKNSNKKLTKHLKKPTGKILSLRSTSSLNSEASGTRTKGKGKRSRK